MIEPTKNLKQFIMDSKELALVDARVLKDLNDKHPLVKNAILIPTNNIIGSYDVMCEFDHLETLNKLTIKPINESSSSLLPTSHQSGPESKIIKKLDPTNREKNRQNSSKGDDGKLTNPENKIKNKIKTAGSRKPGQRESAKQENKNKISEKNKKKYKNKISEKNKKKYKNKVAVKERSNQLVEFLNKIKSGKSYSDSDLQNIIEHDLAKTLLDKLYVVGMHGWKVLDDKLVNESTDIKLDKNNFIVEDGYIVDQNKKRPNLNYNLIYETREKLIKIIENKKKAELNKLKDSIECFNGVIND